MRSFFFAALAMSVVACASPVSDTVTEVPPTETKVPPGNGASSEKPGTDPKSNPPNDEAPVDPASPADCDAFGTAYCQKLFACNVTFSQMFVDEKTCVARFSGWCKARITAPSTGMTHTAIGTCATSINTSSCDALPTDEPPPGCAFKGKLAANAKCALDEQCASGQCSATSLSCGLCLTKNIAGGACTDNDQCDYSHYCTPAKTCAKRPTVGETCSDASGCAASAVCIGGACVAKGKLGEACDPSFGPNSTVPPCYSGHMFECSSVTKKCEPAGFAKLGEPCGFIENKLVFCGGGLACSSSGASGTCQAEIAIGGACTKSNECATPTSCRGGVCSFDSADICK